MDESVYKTTSRRNSGFPASFAELDAAGYIFKGNSLCRACGTEIRWYETPNKKKIPIDADAKQAHWSTCPDADRFRKERQRKAESRS